MKISRAEEWEVKWSGRSEKEELVATRATNVEEKVKWDEEWDEGVKKWMKKLREVYEEWWGSETKWDEEVTSNCSYVVA